jgi:hypothetical protein
MKLTHVLLIATLLVASGYAGAGVATVPGASNWYFHADFNEMRSSDAGRHLYAWLEREVFEDVREDSGIDLGEEADTLTAFAGDDDGAVVVFEGSISQDSKDKLLAMAMGAESVDTFTHKNKTFYFVEGDVNDNIEIDSFDNGFYFSFALKERIVATSTRAKMEELLERNGKLDRSKAKNGSLVVLTAEKSLIQAGMKADRIEDTGGSEGDGGWKSNILRNTEQVAVLVADIAGKLAVETQLITKQPELAESLASVVRGLISLTMLSDDMDPDVSAVLQGTRIDVEGSRLATQVGFGMTKLRFRTTCRTKATIP